MRYFSILAAVGLLTLPACSYVRDTVETGRGYAAHGASELVQAECALSLAERQKNAQAVADLLAADGIQASFMLDCDGDGKPDF